MKIRLVMLGKTRRAELRALLDDYLGRIRRHAEIEALELRDSSAACANSNSTPRLHPRQWSFCSMPRESNSLPNNSHAGSPATATPARANSSSCAAMPELSRSAAPAAG